MIVLHIIFDLQRFKKLFEMKTKNFAFLLLVFTMPIVGILAQPQVSSILFQSLSHDSTYTNYKGTFISYDENGWENERNYKRWDKNEGRWKNLKAYYYERRKDGQPSSEILLEWDTLEQIWQPNHQYLWEHDEDGRTRLETHFYPDESGELAKYSDLAKTFNDNGCLLALTYTK